MIHTFDIITKHFIKVLAATNDSETINSKKKVSPSKKVKRKVIVTTSGEYKIR